MTLFFATLAWWSGPFHAAAEGGDHADEAFLKWAATVDGSWLIAALFFGLAFCSATQDISVDAWAVEGMNSTEESSLAGTLQMVGMICGATLCQVYVMVRWVLPLYVFFGLCGALCVVSGAAALTLGLLHHPKALLADTNRTIPSDSSVEDHASILTYAKEIARSPRARSFVWILLTRAWPYALMPLLTLRLQSHHVIDATLLSQVRMACTLISVLTGMFVASRVVERKTSQGVFRINSRCDFIMYAFSAVLFLVATKDPVGGTSPTGQGAFYEFPYVSKDMYVGIVVVLSVAAAIIGAISFVAVVVQASTEAAYFPRDAATTITLFNAMANLGYVLPSNLVMFCIDPFSRFLAAWLQLPSPAVADRASMAVFTVALLSIAFVTRRLLLVPSVKFLDMSDKTAAKKSM
ncbi:membrane-associated protein, putative [Bodo saltans]|uniref:Membrane-associated protein, putative n=1 Tax=Bodo saltans TaxID=75058 RepID=A0A0S4IR54_BODSA|nr:membrane-associated protein, putative [Bodo saltans]|eukprot:CUG00406.1 membrane-associated protein, putative [Bodo saltans]